MKTIAELKETGSGAETTVLLSLVEAESELRTVLQFQHYNRVNKMGASEGKIKEALAKEVQLVVDFREILGLCSFAKDIDSQGHLTSNLPLELY